MPNVIYGYNMRNNKVDGRNTHTDAGIASVSPAIGRGHSVADRRKLIMAVMLSTTHSSSYRNVDFKAANDHLNPFPESSPCNQRPTGFRCPSTPTDR